MQLTTKRSISIYRPWRQKPLAHLDKLFPQLKTHREATEMSKAFVSSLFFSLTNFKAVPVQGWGTELCFCTVKWGCWQTAKWKLSKELLREVVLEKMLSLTKILLSDKLTPAASGTTLGQGAQQTQTLSGPPKPPSPAVTAALAPGSSRKLSLAVLALLCSSKQAGAARRLWGGGADEPGWFDFKWCRSPELSSRRFQRKRARNSLFYLHLHAKEPAALLGSTDLSTQTLDPSIKRRTLWKAPKLENILLQLNSVKGDQCLFFLCIFFCPTTTSMTTVRFLSFYYHFSPISENS